MAIVGIAPTFMSPIAYRDSSQQLAQASQNNAAALQNAFKFGTQVYDTIKNRQIGEALKKGDTDKAALLESKKINNADPTSFWKWKTDAARAAAQQEADAQKMKGNLLNETAAMMSNVVTNNPEAQAQYINNLNTQKAKLQNAGMDTSVIDQKIAEMTNAMQGNQANIAKQQEEEAFKKNSANRVALMKQYQTADSMRKYYFDHIKELSDDDKLLAIDLIDEQRRKEYEDREGKSWERHGKARQVKAEREADAKQAKEKDDQDYFNNLMSGGR